MCLAVPARLVEMEENRGVVDSGGILVEVGLDLLDDVKVGDYLIIHSGFALEKLHPEEAEKRLELFSQLSHEGYFGA